MDARTILESMQAKVAAAVDAGRVAAEAVQVPDFATSACPRCGGEGEGFFMGSDRAPGVCFRCGGSGKVAKAGKYAAVAKAHEAAKTLARCRATYKALRAALSEIEAAASAATGADARRLRSLAADCSMRIATVERDGKAARAATI